MPSCTNLLIKMYWLMVSKRCLLRSMNTPTAYPLWSMEFVIFTIESVFASNVDLFALKPYCLNLCLSMNLSNLSLKSFSNIMGNCGSKDAGSQFVKWCLFPFLYSVMTFDNFSLFGNLPVWNYKLQMYVNGFELPWPFFTTITSMSLQ